AGKQRGRCRDPLLLPVPLLCLCGSGTDQPGRLSGPWCGRSRAALIAASRARLARVAKPLWDDQSSLCREARRCSTSIAALSGTVLRWNRGLKCCAPYGHGKIGRAAPALILILLEAGHE